jgi:hypothetical protein
MAASRVSEPTAARLDHRHGGARKQPAPSGTRPSRGASRPSAPREEATAVQTRSLDNRGWAKRPDNKGYRILVEG